MPLTAKLLDSVARRRGSGCAGCRSGSRTTAAWRRGPAGPQAWSRACPSRRGPATRRAAATAQSSRGVPLPRHGSSEVSAARTRTPPWRCRPATWLPPSTIPRARPTRPLRQNSSRALVEPMQVCLAPETKARADESTRASTTANASTNAATSAQRAANVASQPTRDRGTTSGRSLRLTQGSGIPRGERNKVRRRKRRLAPTNRGRRRSASAHSPSRRLGRAACGSS